MVGFAIFFGIYCIGISIENKQDFLAYIFCIHLPRPTQRRRRCKAEGPKKSVDACAEPFAAHNQQQRAELRRSVALSVRVDGLVRLSHDISSLHPRAIKVCSRISTNSASEISTAKTTPRSSGRGCASRQNSTVNTKFPATRNKWPSTLSVVGPHCGNQNFSRVSSFKANNFRCVSTGDTPRNGVRSQPDMSQ